MNCEICGCIKYKPIEGYDDRIRYATAMFLWHLACGLNNLSYQDHLKFCPSVDDEDAAIADIELVDF